MLGAYRIVGSKSRAALWLSFNLMSAIMESTRLRERKRERERGRQRERERER
jgi:hypothetical protein